MLSNTRPPLPCAAVTPRRTCACSPLPKVQPEGPHLKPWMWPRRAAAAASAAPAARRFSGALAACASAARSAGPTAAAAIAAPGGAARSAAEGGSSASSSRSRQSPARRPSSRCRSSPPWARDKAGTQVSAKCGCQCRPAPSAWGERTVQCMDAEHKSASVTASRAKARTATLCQTRHPSEKIQPHV